MVPLGDGNPTRTTAVINYTLIGANILVFLHEITLSKPQLEQFLNTWSIVPLHLTQSFQGHSNFGSHPAWITLFTSQFLHGGFLHIAGNMLYLWIFGNNVEDQLGHIRYLFFYLSCGVVAGLAQWFFSAYSTTPSLGASGAIAGVLGAYILRFPRAQVLTLIPLGFFFWTIRLPAYVFLGWWFVQQSLYGLANIGARTNIGMEHGGVAYWAHVGGFLAGVILGPLLGLFA
ncbi:MAG: rhomboid family intramembrane serine protease [Chroococcidiopsidaceae cyanobacterium CP_BM_RX_35]|nr:rhomboid family intramembrane serine protease [Chroococcidiopsidaceae cyanobacterium CP_BM_RX_35]